VTVKGANWTSTRESGDVPRISAAPDYGGSDTGIEREIVADADPLDLLPGLRVKVARVEHLIAVKVLSRDDEQRPQDLVDLRALIRTATQTDVARAREALGLILARGYHRDRDLLPLLESLLV
jgi:hypothetical protein